MIQGTVSNSSVWSSNRQATNVKLVSSSITIFGCLIHNLVESWENVVCKLDFRNGSASNRGKSDPKTDNALFWKGKKKTKMSRLSKREAFTVQTCSQRVELNTRLGPYLSLRPTEARNTPPKATSSPNKQLFGSLSRAMSNALLIA